MRLLDTDIKDNELKICLDRCYTVAAAATAADAASDLCCRVLLLLLLLPCYIAEQCSVGRQHSCFILLPDHV